VTPSPPVEEIIEDVTRRLRARGERMTEPRRAVLRVLAERSEHLSAEDVVTAVTSQDARAHRASVYRTLEALSVLGVVQHVHVGHGRTAYHLIRDARPHLHAQCRACGRVQDLPADLLDEVAARTRTGTGFVLDAAHVALSGLCAGCAAQDSPPDTAGHDSTQERRQSRGLTP
jgi:Fe2+ or Zn2+ uptake regulation protein